ncbi:MAG: hypothetical protein K2X00_11510 [Nitrospiraceae bacterium]|nr:hypothetical protein [Nitrospiraceae bacterium]
MSGNLSVSETGSAKSSNDPIWFYWRRDQRDDKLTTWLSDWPVERPRDWLSRVNRPQSVSELDALRTSVQRGRPFGEEAWVRRMAKRFGMEATLRPRGRPKGS